MSKPAVPAPAPPVQSAPSAGDGGAYRSGVAARLAGLPVETLRVWERRYGISDTGRSPRGQRLYSGAQVHRLGLLKRVVDLGHPIGMVAGLSNATLADLAGAPTPAPAQPPRQIRVALVGDVLGRRLAGERASEALDVVRSCTALTGAAQAFDGALADLLLVESPELSAQSAPLIAAARAALGRPAVVVMYRFCDSATIRLLREQGCLVARAPSDAAEVVQLCRSALAGIAPLAAAPAQAPAQAGDAPPRRFDDQLLAVLTTTPNNIQCECPRHVADILMMLGSFERYSVQCAARNADDAALHRELSRAAGQARVVMEAALERLARAEGLPLPAVPSGAD